MPKPRLSFLNAFAALSLLTCAAIAAVWVRSFHAPVGVRTVVRQGERCRWYVARGKVVADNLPEVAASRNRLRDAEGPCFAALRRLQELRVAYTAAVSGRDQKAAEILDTIGRETDALDVAHRELDKVLSEPTPVEWRESAAWPLPIGAGAASILPCLVVVGAVRRGVRWAAGRCAACGYDLRATTGRCPECGTRVEVESCADR
jgi:hypothetical protein